MDENFSSEQIVIYSSWETANGKRVNDAVYLVKDVDKLDVEDVVSADSCVLLQSKEDSEPETLYIAFKAPAQQLISGISVISEARHLEIYSHLDEYVTTVRSFLLDDIDDDFIAYRSEAEFAHPLNGCRIKFLSLREPYKMWFYGAVLHISERTPEVTPSSSLETSTNVGSIISKLEEDGLQLSGGAKSLAKLLKASNTAGTPPSLSMLLALLGSRADGKPPLPIQSRLNSGKKENAISSNDSQSETPPKKLTIHQNEGIASSESVLVKEEERIAVSNSIVQTLIQESEERLWTKLKKHLTEQEQRQNEKLDRILLLLENKK